MQVIFLIIILLIPFLIYVNFRIFDVLNYYQGKVLSVNFNSIDISRNVNLLVFPLNIFEYSLNPINLFRTFDDISRLTINYFLFFSIIGLFLYLFKGNNMKIHRDFLIIFKLCFITIFVSFYIFPIILNYDFINEFKYRTLEAFFLPIIALSLSTFEAIIKSSKKLMDYLLLKSKSFNKLNRKHKKFSKLFRLDTLIIIIFLSNTSYLFFSKSDPYYEYIYQDDFLYPLLYIRDFAKSGSNIYAPYMEYEHIYNIFSDLELFTYNSSDLADFNSFELDLQEKKIDYLIFKNFTGIDSFPEGWNTAFIENENFSINYLEEFQDRSKVINIIVMVNNNITNVNFY
ncbi:hypothetical protein LCGC14_2960210, partial [marine sediment metagenome]